MYRFLLYYGQNSQLAGAYLQPTEQKWWLGDCSIWWLSGTDIILLSVSACCRCENNAFGCRPLPRTPSFYLSFPNIKTSVQSPQRIILNWVLEYKWDVQFHRLNYWSTEFSENLPLVLAAEDISWICSCNLHSFSLWRTAFACQLFQNVFLA